MVTLRLPLAVLLVSASFGCRKTPPPPPTPPAATAQAAAPARPDATVLPPDYDPTVLVDKGSEPLQVYLAEPRSATWATVVEEAIGGQMRRDLKLMLPEARGLSMGCRTLSCLILVDAPKDKLKEANEIISLVTLGPITVDLGLSPEGRGQVLFLTERRMADPGGFVAWYRGVRRTALADIRSGKRPNTLPVTVDKLPVD
jgi:hypothetical protein